MRRLSVGLALALLLGVAASVFAHEAGSPSDAEPIARILRQRSALGLTAAQATELATILEDLERAAVQRAAAIQAIEQELERLEQPFPLDLPRVETKLREGEALWTERKLARLRALDRAKALLTAEQRERLKTSPARKTGAMAHMHHRDSHLVRALLTGREQLGLTDEQVRALETLLREFEQEAERRSAVHLAVRWRLDALEAEHPVDLGKAEATLKEDEALWIERKLARIRLNDRARALLTEEQRQKVSALVATGSR